MTAAPRAAYNQGPLTHSSLLDLPKQHHEPSSGDTGTVPPPSPSGRGGARRTSLHCFGTTMAASCEPRLDRINRCMTSCPELHRCRKHKWESMHGSEGSQVDCNRRGSCSQPTTPTRPSYRLAPQFRFRRPWASSRHPKATVSRTLSSRFQDPRERRRRARDPQDVGSSSDIESSFEHSPLAGGGASPLLAMAGMTMATEDLDRLSLMARKADAEGGGG
ncbi:hypothetical protein TOPH_08532 [Tolypocladium ophioglossoides CBS 100239]|uniref:Uncharacterized protein n=1 Tax=Tolypocladium ophioglossoides (strain CBS 100239) TaxID=1163406 RepID=A0A0L0MZC6_TOLOC|nr:hypothetical protein TOPH_08532 [Tolypocladium ophioglossoides CBS 100239]